MQETAIRLSDVHQVRGLGKDVTSKLLHRKENICIYERSDEVFEVFKVQIHKEAEIFGKPYPTREAYPSSEDFGKTAWCFTSLDSAMKKYNRLF